MRIIGSEGDEPSLIHELSCGVYHGHLIAHRQVHDQSPIWSSDATIVKPNSMNSLSNRSFKRLNNIRSASYFQATRFHAQQARRSKHFVPLSAGFKVTEIPNESYPGHVWHGFLQRFNALPLC